MNSRNRAIRVSRETRRLGPLVWSVLGLSCLFVASTSSLATAFVSEDELAAKLLALQKNYRSAIVQVSYRQQVSTSTNEPPEEQELTTTGVVVSAEGLVMVSTIIYEPFTRVPHGVGIRFPATVSRAEATISEVRIRSADGNEYAAEVVGRDPSANVAFLRFEPDGVAPSVVSFGDAVAAVGDQVAVISWLPTPLGPGVSVELSRVQAITHRPNSGFVLSTTVSDPVGSLVVDLDGEALGFMDAMVVPVPNTQPRNPLGFLTVFRDLQKGVGRAFARATKDLAGASATVSDAEVPRRGWLGVEMQALSGKLATHLGVPVQQGIVVGYVYRNSPAEKAGIVTGDVLTHVDDDPIRVNRDSDLGTFGDRIVRAGPGTSMRLKLYREGKTIDATAALEPAPRSSREAETAEVEELDLTVRELTYDYLATRFLEPEKEGVVVVEPPVGVSSNPNRVAPGDLLVRVGDRPVSDLESFRDLAATLREQTPDEVIIFVERGKDSFFFALKPEWNR